MRAFQGDQLADYLDSEIGALDENIILNMVEMELQRTAHGDLKFLFQIRCSIHIMQLSLCDVFGEKGGEWEIFLGRCRDLVIELRTPNLFNIIIKRGLPVPLLNVDTRWSSIHTMVSSTEN